MWWHKKKGFWCNYHNLFGLFGYFDCFANLNHVFYFNHLYCHWFIKMKSSFAGVRGIELFLSFKVGHDRKTLRTIDLDRFSTILIFFSSLLLQRHWRKQKYRYTMWNQCVKTICIKGFLAIHCVRRFHISHNRQIFSNLNQIWYIKYLDDLKKVGQWRASMLALISQNHYPNPLCKHNKCIYKLPNDKIWWHFSHVWRYSNMTKYNSVGITEWV